jgi:hypothetical protein
MGRTTRDDTEYRDDPDSLSLHTTPDDFNYDDAPEISDMPPAYGDGPETPNIANSAIRHIPPPSTRMDHNTDVNLSGGVPKVCDTHQVMDARLDTDPAYLEQAIVSYGYTPPTPLVYIMGTHQETYREGDKKKQKTVTDFRIVLNIQKYLTNGLGAEAWNNTLDTVENGDKTYRGSFMKQRAPGAKQDIEVGAAKPTLREWCHRYCASPAKLKIFRLSRTITGFDETYLKNRIDGMLRSTNYRGHISVTFPVEDRNVDIYTSNAINKWRMKNWLRWVFYLTFLWIFSWPYLFFATKRWNVVKAKWAFSSIESGAKVYVTISEEEWFERWNVGIRRLALDRFQGLASEEQLSGVMARPEDPPMPIQMPSINFSGGGGAMGALGALRQGVQVAGALSRGNLVGTTNPGWGYNT